MRIAIYITAEPQWGGVYQYAHSLVAALKKYDRQNEYLIFTPGADFNAFAGDGWQVIRSSGPSSNGSGNGRERPLIRGLKKAKAGLSRTPLSGLKKTAAAKYVRDRAYGGTLAKQFAEHSIDLAVYPTHNAMAAFAGTPFIVAIHDIQHRFQPEFPEVCAEGEYAEREWFFTKVPPKARAVLVDSDTGKEDLVAVSRVEPGRVKVLPFLPPPYLAQPVAARLRDRVKKKYELAEGYLFYPAQFWPHKNHELIVRALAQIKQTRGMEISAVFCGNKDYQFSTFDKVMALGRELGVEAQINYLGYVPGEEMLALYKLAGALVMPTFFGPTNIPVLEAFALDCPVITSDIRGIREQVGEAGLLVDPRNPVELAEAVYRVHTDKDLRAALVKAGRKKIAAWTEADFAARLIGVIEEAGALTKGAVR